MELNINEIASAKIQQMHESGEIRKRIEDGVERSIYDAVDSAVKDYGYRNTLEKSIEKVLGEVASQVDFIAYKNFLISRMNKYISSTLKKETADKVETDFKRLYFETSKEVKLSVILEKYKEWLLERLDESERQEWGSFKIEISTEYKYWIDFKLGRKDCNKYGSNLLNFEFCIHYNDFGKNKKFGELRSVHIGLNDYSKQISFGSLSDFEIFIFNLMYMKIPIVMDIETEDDFDICLYNYD